MVLVWFVSVWFGAISTDVKATMFFPMSLKLVSVL